MSKSAQTERAADRSHSETDRRILQIANRVSATIGMEFFRSIVEHVAEVLPADWVYIGEFVGGQTERVKALAAWPDLHDGIEHELAGSASAQIALGKPCLCRMHARDRFPDDPLLAKLGAEACAGIPLLNSGGHSLGLIMTVYRNPIADPDIPKAILEAFADRAAAELERKQRGELLRQSEERHRAFVALNPDALWRIEFEPPVPTAAPGGGATGTHLSGRLSGGVQRGNGAPDGCGESRGTDRPPDPRAGPAEQPKRTQRHPSCDPIGLPVQHGGNEALADGMARSGTCCEASGALWKTAGCGASGAAPARSRT